MLFMNPSGQVVEVTHNQESVLTFLQTSDVNLSDVDPGAPAQRQQGGMGSMIWIIVIVMLIMMLFASPRKDKEGEKFRNALQLDQDVVTSSGVFGKIKAIDDISVILEVAQNTRIRVDKRYVNPIPVPQPVKQPKKKKAKDPSKEEKA